MVTAVLNLCFLNFTWFLHNIQVKGVVELWAFYAGFIKKKAAKKIVHVLKSEKYILAYRITYLPGSHCSAADPFHNPE